MELFSGLLGKKLTPAWEYSARGVLWRLFPSAAGLLVGEDRDLEKKTVSFFCLDDRSGEVRWSGVTFPEPWWISMEALHHETLLLHEYAAPDMPDHKKILALEAATGKLRWTNDDAKFLFAHGEMVYAAKETYEERVFSEHRIADGALVRRVEPEEIRALQRSQAPEYAEIVDFPATLPPGGGDSPEVGTALRAARLDGAGSVVEVLTGGGALVLASCEPAEGSAEKPAFRQRIAIYDRARGKVAFDDTMHEELSMPIPDMFFRRAGMLYYIKERRTLRAVHLPESRDHA
jgi:hypothetical protein